MADTAGRVPPQLKRELDDGVESMDHWLRHPETRGDPVQAIRGWHWWLERVASGDY